MRKSNYQEWENGVAAEIAEALEIGFSDAVSMMEVQPFFMAQSWGKGLNAAEAAQIIIKNSAI